jgi:hypothetical protein
MKGLWVERMRNESKSVLAQLLSLIYIHNAGRLLKACARSIIYYLCQLVSSARRRVHAWYGQSKCKRDHTKRIMKELGSVTTYTDTHTGGLLGREMLYHLHESKNRKVIDNQPVKSRPERQPTSSRSRRARPMPKA